MKQEHQIAKQEPEDRLKGLDVRSWGLGILLAMMWVLVIVIFLTPEAANSRGLPHETFAGPVYAAGEGKPAMDQGGDGLARHRALILPGWLLGSAFIALFVSLLAWGTHSSAPWRGRCIAFLMGGVLYEGVFAMMCRAYWNSLTEAEVTFFGPFPTGLSMLFGLWPIPAVMIVLYVAYFHRWVFPAESAQRLDELRPQHPANES